MTTTEARGSAAHGPEWEQRMALVQRIPLFQRVSPLSLPEIANLLQHTIATAGTVLLTQGEPGDAMYLIEEGACLVEHTSTAGTRPLARLGPGEFFGEHSLLAGGPRSATVRADTDMSLWVLSRQDFAALSQREPAVGTAVAEAAEQRAKFRDAGDYGLIRADLGALSQANGQVRVGRADDNDLVLDSRLVSTHHAILRNAGQSIVVEDTSADGATFVNGAPVKTATLKEGDHVFFGDQHLVWSTGALNEVISPRAIRIEAAGLRKEVKGGKNLLQNISLSIAPGEMVAIVGTSGAGKSTLMDALSGVRPPTHGEVRYNGEDVTHSRDRYRESQGYVPQDDIIHRDLPVKVTLDYAARLRLPGDTSKAERQAIVQKTLEDLQIAAHADTKVSALSGGQRKRCSIGVELLTKPRVFFLDEPTSGLDPATDTAMMKLLRRLSHDGATVLLTTHATKNVLLCDKVVFMARGGSLAFFGTPRRALEHFGCTEFDQIYELLEGTTTPEEWAQRYAQTPEYAFVAQLHAQAGPAMQDPGQQTRQGGLGRSISQFVTLSSRNAQLFLSNSDRLAPLFIGPIALALLMLALFRPGAFDPDTDNLIVPGLICFLLVFSGFLIGLTSGLQEIASEFAIIKRERLVNLKLTPYILSKMTFLAPVLSIGMALMLVILGLTDRIPDLSVAEYAAVWFTMVLSTLLALAIAHFTSAAAPSAQTANDLAPAWIMPQVLFSGGLFPIAAMITVGEAISTVMPLRYGFQAAGNVLDVLGLYDAAGGPVAENLAAQYRDQFDVNLAVQWAVMGAAVVILLVAAGLVLRRKTAPQ
ncbi:ATP-binding cassette domain-containing protein [Euzebya pacifica]|uniref:ATP-binding cassette domain-containing protein n=1 Tax=Euzebya pacifica TaxID=1608957 RepID=UPI0030FC233C